MEVQIVNTVDGVTTFQCVGNSSVHGVRWTLDDEVILGHTDVGSDVNFISTVTVESGSRGELKCCLLFSDPATGGTAFICGSRSLLVNNHTGIINRTLRAIILQTISILLTNRYRLSNYRFYCHDGIIIHIGDVRR